RPAGDDAWLVVVCDGHPRTLARCVGERVVGEDRATEVEDRDQQQDEDRQDERELDQGLAAVQAAAPWKSDHGLFTVMLLLQGTCELAVIDCDRIVKLPFGAPGPSLTGPGKPAPVRRAWALL